MVYDRYGTWNQKSRSSQKINDYTTSIIIAHSKISLLLLLFTLLDLGCAVWAQQAVFSQDSFENTSNQTGRRLDAIIELLEQLTQGSITQLNMTIIVFMMGLAFVIFGLYIGQEHKLSIFTKRLYLIAYFALHCYSCKIHR